ADAEEAAGFLHVQMLGQVEGVVVAVPGEEATFAELDGECERRVVGIVVQHAHCEGGAAVVEALGISDAIDLESWNLLQARDDSLQQRALVFVDQLIRSFDGCSSFAYLKCHSPGERGIAILRKPRKEGRSAADVGDVFDTGGDSGNALVVERAPLPAIGNCIRVGTYFVGTQPL